MKKIAALVLLLFIVSSQMEGTQSVDVAFDCHDKCTKDCLNGDSKPHVCLFICSSIATVLFVGPTMDERMDEMWSD